MSVVERLMEENAALRAEVQRLGVENKELGEVVDQQAADLARVRAAVTSLHGLVEEACNGWAGALPHGEDVSRLVQQDRLTTHDLKRKADAIERAALGGR